MAWRYRQPIGRPRGIPRANQATVWLLSPTAPVNDIGGADGPNARTDELGRLEAVLFLSREPQPSRKLAQLAGLADGTKTRTLVRTLNRLYDAEGSAFRVEEVAGGFLLMSRARFAPWLGRLQSAPVEVRLSAPAMETLAVVAYRQPVLRADVEAIRGVQSGEILRQLIERDLVRITGRSDELGRPFLYGTTKQFLQVFGLRRLDELPRADVLRATEPSTKGVDSELSDADREMSNRTSHSHEAEEEVNVRSPTTMQAVLAERAEKDHAAATETLRNEQPDDELPFDDDLDDDDFDDDYDEDDDLDDDEDDDEDDEYDDEPWEEVEDDDEEEEYEDEDWDDEDEWEDDDDEEWEEYDDEEE